MKNKYVVIKYSEHNQPYYLQDYIGHDSGWFGTELAHAKIFNWFLPAFLVSNKYPETIVSSIKDELLRTSRS